MTTGQSSYFDVAGQTGGFIQIPRFVARRTDMSLGAKMTLGFMLDVGWNTEQCWLSQESLCSSLGCKTDALRRYIGELVAAGYLEVIRRGQGQTNMYQLHEDKILGLEAMPQKTVSGKSMIPQKTVSHAAKNGILNNEELEKEELKKEHLSKEEDEEGELLNHPEIGSLMARLTEYEAFVPTDGFWKAVDSKYTGLDLREEVEKLTDWAERNKRQVTRGFVLNWLKRAAQDAQRGPINGRADQGRRGVPEDELSDEERESVRRWASRPIDELFR